jgi:hypothetical protein
LNEVFKDPFQVLGPFGGERQVGDQPGRLHVQRLGDGDGLSPGDSRLRKPCAFSASSVWFSLTAAR